MNDEKYNAQETGKLLNAIINSMGNPDSMTLFNPTSTHPDAIQRSVSATEGWIESQLRQGADPNFMVDSSPIARTLVNKALYSEEIGDRRVALAALRGLASSKDFDPHAPLMDDGIRGHTAISAVMVLFSHFAWRHGDEMQNEARTALDSLINHPNFSLDKPVAGVEAAGTTPQNFAQHAMHLKDTNRDQSEALAKLVVEKLHRMSAPEQVASKEPVPLSTPRVELKRDSERTV